MQLGQCALSALFIILVSLTMTRFSEKMLISTRCIHGFMSNLIKKSWTDSTPQATSMRITWFLQYLLFWLKSVHFKKTVARISFLSKLWYFQYKSKQKVPQFWKKQDSRNWLLIMKGDLEWQLVWNEMWFRKQCTGSPLIVRFLGPRKNRTNGNPYY